MVLILRFFFFSFFGKDIHVIYKVVSKSYFNNHLTCSLIDLKLLSSSQRSVNAAPSEIEVKNK